ncbi:MAG: N-6 DNA methylase [Bdellovibrionales bacterium]|nr:N-6 DNA methylase [Bdellovibrionales bacterium]
MEIESLSFESKHLSPSDQIKQGSFYTPKKIVDKVHQLTDCYKNQNNTVIFDNSAGAGAFIKAEKNIIYKVAEVDITALQLLKDKLPQKQVFSGNSLSQVTRSKYNISPIDFLIQVGNPPYNDTTSAYKNGQKGTNICDKDLFDRDLGISFLKSYSKLEADIVCVLHPLSYLIKKANFKRLKGFAQNYILKKGVLFSSSMFKNVSSTAFPIVIALYKKSLKGMNYPKIQNFKFSIMDSKAHFVLNKYKITDSFIRKYPPKKTDDSISDIGLYYYTFRDINSLKRNRAFHTKRVNNSIVVSMKELYKYAYLFAFKKLFQPIDSWIYGNLSPLGQLNEVKKNSKLFIKYLFITEKQALDQLNNQRKNKILKYYCLKRSDLKHISEIKEKTDLLIHSLSGLNKKEVYFQNTFDFI